MKTVLIDSGDNEIARGPVVYDAITGNPLHGVYAVDVSMRADDCNRAIVQFVAAPVRTKAYPTFTMPHPENGKLTEIRRIQFEDGTWWPEEAASR